MRLAITADWLVTAAGAERVLAEMIRLWPEAPVFTTVYKTGCLAPLEPDVRTSSLQQVYRILGKHRILIPFMPRAVESWDLREFDVVLSSSHAVAKGCIPQGGARHICYCHTPMRYAWEMEEEYLDDFGLRGPLKALARRELAKLRRWDLTTAKRVDSFIANSHEVADRIKRIYGRESIVLHPPVSDRFFDVPLLDSSRMSGTRSKKTYFLCLGRLVPYKHFDLAIEVANREKLPLIIAGEGPDEKRLRKMAGDTVRFLGRVSEEELQNLYMGAKATIFPAHEDAGIVPLESQACGTPVIAFGEGGVRDTVKDGETGIFFYERNADALYEAINMLRKTSFDAEETRSHAKQFSSSTFREKLETLVRI